MIPGHLRSEVATPDPLLPVAKGFGYTCTPCDIRGWAKAPSPEEVTCWSCGKAASTTHPSIGVHGVDRTNPDVADGTSDRALWI